MFDALARERHSRLVAFATILAGTTDAEDLVQDALIATFSRRRSFPTVGHAEQYVRRAIAHKYIDAHRKRSRDDKRAQRTAPREALPDNTESAMGDRVLMRALSDLPPRTRACVVLRFLEDASVRETAAALGLSEGAVKRYVSDGLRTLNARLGEDIPTSDPPTARVDTHRGVV
jgi:RNA polymerase sigma-70 factor (sigma-E family)